MRMNVNCFRLLQVILFDLYNHNDSFKFFPSSLTFAWNDDIVLISKCLQIVNLKLGHSRRNKTQFRFQVNLLWICPQEIKYFSLFRLLNMSFKVSISQFIHICYQNDSKRRDRSTPVPNCLIKIFNAKNE